MFETTRPVVDAIPEFETLKSVVDAELATRNGYVAAEVSVPQTVSCEYGVDVPMPRLPPSVRRIFSVLLVFHAKYSPVRLAPTSAWNVVAPLATSMRKSVPLELVSLMVKIAVPLFETRRSFAVSVVPSNVRLALEVMLDADVQYATRLVAPLPLPVTKFEVSVLVMQVEPTAKHPAESLMPFANVEVAEVDVMLSAVDWMPAAKVDVAPPLEVMRPALSILKSVEVTPAAVVEPIEKRFMFVAVEVAWRERSANGVEVPIPVRPVLLTTKCVCVEEPIANSGPVPMFAGFTDSCAHGEEDAMPRNPAEVNVEVAVPPICTWFAEKTVDDACCMFVTYVVVVGWRKFPLTCQSFTVELR